MVKLIKLTKGLNTIVDDEDYKWLSKWKWHTGARNYAIRVTYLGKYPKRKSVRHTMANELMRPPKGYVVDHINGDKLDNRKSNLRIATVLQNNCNRPSKGIVWHKSAKKWQAQIQYKKKYMYLGLFEDKDEALKVYQQNANKYFGEFARQS